MKERPILFSAPMVRAILDDRKTQTRRVIKPQPVCLQDVQALQYHAATGEPFVIGKGNPYGQPGDRLWVRETHALQPTQFDFEKWVIYKSDNEARRVGMGEDETAENWSVLGYSPRQWSSAIKRWSPSIFMPRWASRITLEITGVRVERLNEINDRDAIQEGIIGEVFQQSIDVSGIAAYRRLWESINGPGSWDQNPWVWVLEFRRVE